MITTSDIANIIYSDARRLEIPEVYQSGNIPSGAVTSERVIVIVNEETRDVYWNTSVVKVNILVPDVDLLGTADLVRLQEVQRLALRLFDSRTAEYDGTWYYYEVAGSGVFAESGRNYHFVNIRINFKVLND